MAGNFIVIPPQPNSESWVLALLVAKILVFSGTVTVVEAELRSSARLSRIRLSRIKIAFATLCLLILALVAALVVLPTSGLLHLLTMVRGGHILFNVDQPTVVRQIQQLQRLETVSYTMDKIISAERGNRYLPKFLIGDRILLIVHGEVIAGVNLATIQPSDVSARGTDISIRLPTAEVFSTRIDNARTRVYSRDTGLFTSPDPNLESQVREEAERQLQQAALQDGILKAADQNARNTVSSMLKGLGFLRIEIR